MNFRSLKRLRSFSTFASFGTRTRAAHRRPLAKHSVRERGATMVEFALASFVFFLFIIFIIEMARILAIRAALTKGAQDAVIFASKLPAIELDTRGTGAGASFVPLPANATNFQQYRIARDLVHERAVQLPLSMFLHTTVTTHPGVTPSVGMQNLLPMQIPLGNGTTKATDAILLRPDDYDANVGYTLSDGSVVRYPPNALVPGQVIGPTSDITRMLLDNPIIVQVYADVSPIFPLFQGFGNFRLMGQAASFREPPPDGALGFNVPGATPTATPLPTATYTSTPTPTPTNTPFPTDTPFPTETPSPTATAGPTNTAVPTATGGGTPSATPTPTYTSTPTGTGTATPTPTGTGSGTPTATPSPTETSTPTATPTSTSTPTPTPTDTPTPTPTPEPTCAPGTPARFLSEGACEASCANGASGYGHCSFCTCNIT